MLELLPVVTTIWGLVMALAPILQIRLIAREKDASGISVIWICILIVGFLLWLAYGLALKAAPLIITNTVSAVVALALLTTVLVFRRRASQGVGRRSGL
ncbi:SemiSWEET family transporter [Ammonicoccus fulvus]|uniref:SemiSWEET family transporter n=1 Tax=Ammonicoccus fulvus TaxID=3138240 RepID=A0ABZ3FTR8_9ACTN